MNAIKQIFSSMTDDELKKQLMKFVKAKKQV